MSFAQSAIPSARGDAAALAAWRGGNPNDIVLPLAVAAAWAYADLPVFDTVMHRRDLLAPKDASTSVEVANDAMFVRAKAYIVKIGDGAVIAFRGTEPTNLINWLADATLEKAAFHAKADKPERGYVHGGFYRNTRAIWPNVIETLQAMDPAWMYFTGHSFGAAMAVLSGALLSDYESEKPATYGKLWGRLRGIVTFGQPMVGDTTFANHYRGRLGEKLKRFVYANDIVPHLPPKTHGWTPMHFGPEYRAPSGDEMRWTEQASPSKFAPEVLQANLIGIAAWVKDQTGLAPKLTLPYSWGSHAPNNYVRASLPLAADSGSEFD